jgi:hypothetical protein
MQSAPLYLMRNPNGMRRTVSADEYDKDVKFIVTKAQECLHFVNRAQVSIMRTDRLSVAYFSSQPIKHLYVTRLH